MDDIKINITLISKILQRMGCEISAAVTGKQAVEMIGHNKYDMIFMDCQMPEMDGFEATKFIRENEGSNHNIIIALTADAMTGDREKCLIAGMDDYLNKPVRPDKVTEVLFKWFD